MPPKPPPLLALLADFQRACSDLRIGWYLFGAQAALLYGSPRLTADADLTVQLGTIPPSSLGEALVRHGFELRESDAAVMQATRVLPVLHTASGFPADVVLGGPGLEELFLERAVSRNVHGVDVTVARAEDLITMKVLAGRRKDEEDVVAVLSAQRGKLDLDLIRSTLRDLTEALAQDDLLPAFERLFREAK